MNIVGSKKLEDLCSFSMFQFLHTAYYDPTLDCGFDSRLKLVKEFIGLFELALLDFLSD